MENKPNEGIANGEFSFNPTDKVIGIIDDAVDANAALRDLRAAGFTADELEILMGEEGAQRIDVTAERHEASVHVVDSTLKPPAYYDAPAIVSRVEQEVMAGHYIVGVTAKKSEARDRALAVLKSHGGHFINFYGRWAAESLEP